MNHKYVVYKLTSPSGKSYIGITSNLKNRLRTHRKSNNKSVISNAIKKYGWNNFKIEIIATASKYEILFPLERFFILYEETYKRNKGYNISLGGEGTLGVKHPYKKLTDSHKQKISIGNKGKVLSETTKKNISKALKGKKVKPFTDEHKHNISDSLKGKKVSDELLNKWNESKKGRKLSEETKEKLRQVALRRWAKNQLQKQ